jgi:urease accessory protein
MTTRTGIFSIALLAAATATTAAGAHSGAGAGLIHPFTGADHVLAMLAVGLWAGLSGGRARVAVPAAFAVLMVAGALLAIAGVALPGIEAGIAASVVVFGLLAATALRLNVWAGAGIAGAFALFHGAAHGAEMGAASALTFIAGFVAATLVLQLSGVAAADLLRRARAEFVVRAAGGAAAAAGLAIAVS